MRSPWSATDGGGPPTLCSLHGHLAAAISCHTVHSFLIWFQEQETCFVHLDRTVQYPKKEERRKEEERGKGGGGEGRGGRGREE